MSKRLPVLPVAKYCWQYVQAKTKNSCMETTFKMVITETRVDGSTAAQATIRIAAQATTSTGAQGVLIWPYH